MYDDHRNLCTWKKLPDAQLAEYVYDNGGRLTQQGECTNKTVSSDQVVHVQNWAVGFPNEPVHERHFGLQ